MNSALTRKDLASDQEIRWCPGCGDYSIVKSVQTALAELGVPLEQMVVVSGIGCAARLPYYMNTYGFHTIHGRAPGVATGVKMANPNLSVWVAGGDGDLMSIGGNHLLHLLRRNVDLTVLLFNNRIYGLTKGQFSPTTGLGKRTASTPMGSIDPAFDPISVALGAGATFVARSADIMQNHLQDILAAAHAHKGTSFIEILQNCIIYNDGAFDDDIGRKVRADRTIELTHGKPLRFGQNNEKGLRLKGMDLEVVTIGVDCNEDDILVFDAHSHTTTFATALTSLPATGGPVPMGIFRSVEMPTYEQSMNRQVQQARAKYGDKGPTLDQLFNQGDCWTVEAD